MSIFVYRSFNKYYVIDMSYESKKIMLIVNPSSGKGKSIDLLPVIDKKFSGMGVKTDIKITENIQQASEIARLASQCGYKRIAAMGGDGTVNMVAAGLLNSNSILAVIPAGIGNGFFKQLKIKDDIDSICQAAAFGKQIELDVGILNDQPFFNMIGIGFDAEVAIEANKANINLGIITYLLAVYKIWKKFPTFDIKLRIDSLEIEEQVMLAAIGIGRSTGGGFFLTPNALPNDGKFDVCIVQKTNRFRIFSILPKIIKGTHIRQPEVKVYRCRQLEIFSEQSLPVHYEGETFINNNGRLSIKMSVNISIEH